MLYVMVKLRFVRQLFVEDLKMSLNHCLIVALNDEFNLFRNCLLIIAEGTRKTIPFVLVESNCMDKCKRRKITLT